LGRRYKMITVRLRNIIDGTEVLRKLAGQPLKGRTAFQVSKILKKLEEELNLFNSTRVELIKKYSKVDENNQIIQDENGNVQLQEDKLNDFNNEIAELLNTPIEINSGKIKLVDIEDINFTPAEMMALEELIEE